MVRRVRLGLVLALVATALLAAAFFLRRPTAPEAPATSGPVTMAARAAPEELEEPDVPVDAGPPAVTHGLALEGVVTLRGRPAGAATVTASTATRRFTTTSSMLGAFTFDDLSGEAWVVEASLGEAFARQSVDLPSSRRLELPLQTAWALEGTVRTRGGAPIRGARIALDFLEDQSMAMLGQAISGDDGHYLLRTLRPKVEVSAEGPGFADSEPLKLELSAPRTSADFVLEPEAELSGVVVDPQGQGVQDVQVQVNRRASAVTTLDGRFALSHLAAGSHLVTVVRAGRVELTERHLAPSSSLRFELPATCALEGRVLQSGGGALPRLRVGVASQNRLWGYVTDDEGRFRAEELPCESVVKVSSRRRPAFSQTVQLAGEVTWAELRVPEVMELSGVVVAADGQPIAFAKVFGEHLQRTTADEAGRFTLSVPADTRAIAAGATAEGYASGVLRQAVDRVSELRIVLQADTRLVVRGRVVDEAGAPLPEFSVAAEAISSSDGSFTVRPCPSAEQSHCPKALSISAPGRVPVLAQVSGGGSVLELGTIVLPAGRRVQLLVRDSRGTPLSYAWVEAANSRDEPARLGAAHTFADGRAELTGMPSSGFWVHAGAADPVDGGERTSEWSYVESTSDEIELLVR